MAADLTHLMPEFHPKVDQLLARCLAQGFAMRPYMALRTPLEQARLWRQSRSREEIDAKVAEFKAKGAPFLAQTLIDAGPQHGDPVTNAEPGLSWHQWGEAVDCFWVVNGQAEWSTKRLVNGRNGYAVYADAARALGLTAGGFFTSLKDWPHVQLRTAGSPLGAGMSLAQVDAFMKQHFGR
jgi:hypothetical protein